MVMRHGVRGHGPVVGKLGVMTGTRRDAWMVDGGIGHVGEAVLRGWRGGLVVARSQVAAHATQVIAGRGSGDDLGLGGAVAGADGHAIGEGG